MALWRKHSSPVDRAVDELDRQIASIQKQLREVSAENSGNRTASPVGATSTVPGSSRAKMAVTFIKELLTPPENKPHTPAPRVRRDLFDVPVEPLKDLEAEPAAFVNRTPPDLFGETDPNAGRAAGAGIQSPIDCSTKPDERLAHYLSAGSFKTYKPLKHVQRQTRNRFYMWLGLSLVALWVLYAVIR